MASSINPNNIDGTYPIAGQDNDSQGFRDNFTNIKNNLTFAKTELEDLQSKVIVTSQLEGGSAIEAQNNLNNTLLVGAQLKKTTQTINDLGQLSGTVDVSWADGSYQILETTGSVNLTFSGWPTSGFYSSLILETTVASTAHTITLPSEVSVGNSSIQGCSTSNVITFNETGTYQFEFSTTDNGDTITIKDLSRNYDKVTSEFTIGNAILNTGYQYANSNASFGNLVTGNTFTVSSSVNRVILDPTSGFASLYINLPANVNAKTIRISSTANITAVSVSGATGTVVKPAGNITLTQGEPVEYFYLSSTGTWYRS